MPPGVVQPRDSKALFFAGLFLLCCLPFAGPAFSADETARKLREAETHFSRGEYLEALADYQDVLEQPGAGDHRAKALMMSAAIHSAFLKDPETALALYGQVRERCRGSVYEADAIFESARVEYERERYREASRLFGLYLAKFPFGSRRDVAAFMRDASDHPPGEADRKAREQAARRERGNAIRVLVLENAGEIRVASSSRIEVRNPSGGGVLSTIAPRQETRLRFDGGLLFIGGQPYPLAECLLSAGKGGMLRVNGTLYRGTWRIAASGQGRLAAHNLVDLEEYLYGVVPKEMPPAWPDEALKAQAVVSRTFARYQKEANAARDYDICATTSSQVYGGVPAETDRTRRAVDATRGRFLAHGGRPALTYFHANSGGVTEDARHVWRVAIPYLLSIPDEPSARAPGSSWTAFLTYAQIRDALNRNGFKVGEIRGVELSSVSPSGRVTKVRIDHSSGTTILSGNQFRTSTDPALIKSTLFTAGSIGPGIRFEGRGSGHGVGLSQWGARMMAEGGSPYREILLHYYKGLDLN
ncbi:MAG: SpoIID/LytB domain-containing protein [Pseudomonadota bacterium]|jgi:stage II sporulation protein D|nr:SpoIID/LytB domain-containing protein [Syntrophobacterales bacterium]MDI9554427.1 SpoIID/LytB domain-containing protein [Pseudomonadota bacterium]NLX30178.1 SpoIID/LytB domain-containing protein [Deltaproteobacteria bacterium]HNU84747.1 SpoIID/LytB domain-containing protein [Syntrophales bacterium]HNZ33920.1 SpoIID/LytB domain-containing protein [Syntrophales bacterium]